MASAARVGRASRSSSGDSAWGQLDRAERRVVELPHEPQCTDASRPDARRLATRERYRISYWDAAILEASRALGCDVVLSEDLSDGEDYAGVRVENPFRGC